MNYQKKIKLGLLSLCFIPTMVMAQNNPPQIQPTYPEVGINWTPPNSSSTNTTTSSNNNSNSASSSSTSGGDSLQKMMTQDWGQQAATYAETVGINADALAATCVMESNCTNVTSTHGSITGAFQMTQSTYNAMIKEAMVENPSLNLTQDQINNGQNDPTIQAIAASQYLKDGATYLKNNGISNPNNVDVRGYYNFGTKYGAAVAKANDSDSMSTVLSGMSFSTLAANGITSSTTVGQWRAAVANKMGASANNSVLKS
ncbi:hypothetical protein [Commensalibacter nepenthis]|uniref:Transglycosylase SLT domain-containing protein n=1 Tax=Commensalibacter nepenthis TaxID=3043872 RepID=A0ABT6Q6B2_9PROT|nr:hypothetical protein [Commensalibacter sp. TBRC 10068]MDI2111783.1 hypothetical protein [Commensalibacter sp. TBRC 10068]